MAQPTLGKCKILFVYLSFVAKDALRSFSVAGLCDAQISIEIYFAGDVLRLPYRKYRGRRTSLRWIHQRSSPTPDRSQRREIADYCQASPVAGGHLFGFFIPKAGSLV